MVVPVNLAIALVPAALAARACFQRASRGPHTYASGISALAPAPPEDSAAPERTAAAGVSESISRARLIDGSPSSGPP